MSDSLQNAGGPYSGLPLDLTNLRYCGIKTILLTLHLDALGLRGQICSDKERIAQYLEARPSLLYIKKGELATNSACALTYACRDSSLCLDLEGSMVVMLGFHC